MRIAVTGTPGTGKTTATRLLESRDDEFDLETIHLNEVIEAEELYVDVDDERDSAVADLDALEQWLDGRDDVVIESHLAHHFDVDRVAVLRCRPAELERRLFERGEPTSKAKENAESEAIDVVLTEAVDQHGLESIYEIDTSGRDPEAVASRLADVVSGTRTPSAGTVDFIDYLA